jgi:hypothetical protein
MEVLTGMTVQITVCGVVTLYSSVETSRYSGWFLRNVGNIFHRRGHQVLMVRIRISSEKTKNKMGGRRPEGHSTDPTNKRMEKRSRRRKRMEAPFERGQVPEEAVAPHVDGWTDTERRHAGSQDGETTYLKTPTRSLLFPHPAAHPTGSDDIAPCLDADNTCFELV